VHPTRWEERDPVVAQEPRGGLGDVARVGVLGQERDEPTAELVLKRREHEREHGLRHTRARRQSVRERPQALIGAKPFDEAVENGTVHGVRPNEAFGRAAIVLGPLASI
jgi:hypothetical protein